MVSGDATALRHTLVDSLLAAGLIQTPAVEHAFRTVPRHLFLPGTELPEAYADEAIVTKWAADGRPLSSSSQPAIMALMLEQLDVRPGHRVLEIGAGTGYNAALLAELVGPSGQVLTIDVDPELADQARAHLAAAGRTETGRPGAGGEPPVAGAGPTGPTGTAAESGGPVAAEPGRPGAAEPGRPGADGAAVAGAGPVRVVCADGADGDPAGGTFDRIIVTAGAWDLAPAWHQQLAAGGRLVLPLAIRGMQRSVGLEPDGAGWRSVSVIDGGFMPLRGAMAEPGGPRRLGDVAGLFIALDDDRELDTDALYAALAGPGVPVPVGVPLEQHEVWTGLSLWLALHEPDYCGLSALGPAVERRLVPPLFAFAGHAATLGLVGPASLAILAGAGGSVDPPAGRGSAADAADGSTAGPALVARGHGPAGPDLARRLADQVRAWADAGRPGTTRLRIRAYPPGTEPVPAEPGAVVVAKRHTRLILDWPGG
ncbi:MAG TPA: methyltransferase domain-containing protein [Mycobacteriales bacterium]|nr:methyltransferase domain-containing protein [Mycobacteriales bacterium]